VDLETICLKCLHPEPTSRYATATDLAADLGRFLAGEPISARPVSSLEKFGLWRRKRPIQTALSAAQAVALLFGVSGIILEWRQAAIHASGEARQRQVTENYARRIQLELYAADISVSSHAIERGDLGLARTTLARLDPKPGEEDLRGFEWRYLANLAHGSQIATLSGHTWIVTCAAFSPDSRHLVSAGWTSEAQVWTLGSDLPPQKLAGHVRSVWSATYSPDGSQIVTTGSDQSVRFWDATTLLPVPILRAVPAGFTQEFTRMRFLCSGGLDEAQLPSTSVTKHMVYWDADIIPQSIQFAPQTNESCTTANRFLVLGVQTSLPFIPQAFHAALGFKPDGNLVSAADGVQGINSRFALPGMLNLQGSGTSLYPLTTASDGYFNSWENPQRPQAGFFTFAGKLRTPFFGHIKVQLLITPSRGGGTPQIGLAGAGRRRIAQRRTWGGMKARTISSIRRHLILSNSASRTRRATQAVTSTTQRNNIILAPNVTGLTWRNLIIPWNGIRCCGDLPGLPTARSHCR
jgi:hypothetical protein